MKNRVGFILMLMAAFMLLTVSVPVYAVDGKININTATKEELCQLQRVGPAYAGRIIKYRETSKFEVPADIKKVKGIGPKTFEANKELIVVKDE